MFMMRMRRALKNFCKKDANLAFNKSQQKQVPIMMAKNNKVTRGHPFS